MHIFGEENYNLETRRGIANCVNLAESTFKKKKNIFFI